MQLRHVLEVHAVDRPDQCRSEQDRSPRRNLLEVVYQVALTCDFVVLGARDLLGCFFQCLSGSCEAMQPILPTRSPAQPKLPRFSPGEPRSKAATCEICSHKSITVSGGRWGTVLGGVGGDLAPASGNRSRRGMSGHADGPCGVGQGCRERGGATRQAQPVLASGPWVILTQEAARPGVSSRGGGVTAWAVSGQLACGVEGSVGMRPFVVVIRRWRWISKVACHPRFR